MKIPQKTKTLLNQQFYNELFAAHLYLGLSSKLEASPYVGMCKWMKLQAKEEMEHAMKIYDYLMQCSSGFELSELKKPELPEKLTPLEAFEAALEHEKLVSSQINKIFELANDEKDWLTADFMTWFLREQLEEENTAKSFVRGLEFAGDDKSLLIGVDQWAAKRAQ